MFDFNSINGFNLNDTDRQYFDLIKDILTHGQLHTNRTGISAYSVFGRTMRFNLQDHFPLLLTKKVNFDSVVAELLWFLEGSTNRFRLNEMGSRIWDQWALESGELGPIYGKQFRSWEVLDQSSLTHKVNQIKTLLGQKANVTTLYKELNLLEEMIRQPKTIDQIDELIKGLREDPMSRRHIVTSWNPSVVPKSYQLCLKDGLTFKHPVSPQDNVEMGLAALPACHTLFQFYTSPSEQGLELSCLLLARSQDVPIGTPYNIACYSLLTHMVAQCCNMIPKEFIWFGGDCHIYENQLEGIEVQLKRTINEKPQLQINPDIKEIFDFTQKDITLLNYHPHPFIPIPVAV